MLTLRVGAIGLFRVDNHVDFLAATSAKVLRDEVLRISTLTQFISLNCPNCGAAIPRETLKCEYCGSESILAADGLRLRGLIVCPKCGASMGDGSWFCVRCRQVLLKDTMRLKELQKKSLFQQQRNRELMPEIAQRLEPQEFIYFLLHGKSFWHGRRYWLVTDKRFIVFEGGNLWEMPWNEVVGVGTPQFKNYGNSFLHFFSVQTFKGDVEVRFGESNQDCWTIYRSVMKGLGDYNTQRTDIRAIICSLKFGDENQTSPVEATPGPEDLKRICPKCSSKLIRDSETKENVCIYCGFILDSSST